MNKRRFDIAVPARVLLTAAIAVIPAGCTDTPSSADSQGVLASASPDTAAVNVVAVTRPVQRSMSRDLEIPATLIAYETADLYVKVSGYVAAVNVDIGDAVKAGDPLVELDIPEMADELRQAEAVLTARQAKVRALKAQATAARLGVDSAEAQLNRALSEMQLERSTRRRMEELFEAEVIPEQQLDEARSEAAVTEAVLQIAEAEVARAEGDIAAAEANVAVGMADVAVAEARIAHLQTMMEYAVLRAPYDGVITRRFIDPGAFVRSAADGTTTPLLAIASRGRIRLAMDVPEPAVPKVRQGTKIQLTIPALGTNVLSVTVSRTAWSLNPDTRTMRIEADLDDRDGTLRPGMYARALIHIEADAALTVPSAAIRVRAGETYLLVVRDGLAQERPVTVGYDNGIIAAILDGLTGDELVITSATSAVAAGVSVTPVLDDDSSPEARG
ncbi:MAG: efflux RND transporter periplasmic adaptor subunit [Planctomycetes bacterium]|nr:efflux RND transporter periplasmic adaptor subunit [Planctomycetota bacterium]